MTNDPQQLKIGKRSLTLIVICAVVLFAILLIVNLDQVNAFLASLLTVFRPLLIGLVIAYLANPIFRLFERKLFVHVRPIRFRRVLSLIATYLIIALIIAGLLLLIIPQLIASVQTFFKNFDNNLNSIIDQLNGLLSRLGASLPLREDGTPMIPVLDAGKIREQTSALWNDLIRRLEQSIKPENLGFIKDLFNQTTNILTDLIFGFFISVYLLSSKEKRYAQIMKFRRAYFSETVNNKITSAVSMADHSFGGFLRGKIMDSFIVGILVYIVCLIFRIPYAVLAAVIVGITDIIPVIGPFIGVIPMAIIILLTEPIKVIVFLICILVIQQIDGNIIAPKILGENTGVSSLCVLISILVMGELMGLVGMLIGVPLFATVIELTKPYLDRKLHEKGLPSAIENYAQDTVVTHKKKKRSQRSQKAGTSIQSGSGSLTPLEHLQLRTYALARKHRIFTDHSDEILDGFAAEATVLFAAESADIAAAEESNAPNIESDSLSAFEESDDPIPEQETKGDDHE